MKDAERQKHIARIEALREEWVPRLCLEHWRFKFLYGHDEAANANTASCQAHWEYQQATINWNLTEVARSEDFELTWTLLHELMHCVLAELEAPADSKGEERVASHLATAFLRMSDGVG